MIKITALGDRDSSPVQEGIETDRVNLYFQLIRRRRRKKLDEPEIKIVVLGTRGFPHVQGGIEAHCENLYPQLVKKGYEIIVLTRKPYVNPDIGIYKGIKLIPLPCPKNKFLETFLHTFIGVLVAKKFSPDILHIHAIGPSLFTPLARFLGLKVIMTNHGPDYQRKKWGKLARCVLKLSEKSGSTWANDIICISETIAHHVKRKYNRYVNIIPNGVTITKIAQSSATLRNYALTKGRYILSVGRFVPEKGFHDLIEAFNRISTSIGQSPGNTWKLVIIGCADHEDRYSIRLKDQADKNNNIILTGFLTGEPLQEFYSHAGLFVIPSYYEGLPIVLLEAMSYGLSCIASDISANKNVELSENRFFKAGDVKGLAEKIQEYLDKPLCEEEKKEQITMIAERYNWDTIANKTANVYKGIMNGKR